MRLVAVSAAANSRSRAVRAETEQTVAQIKQSLELLRRSL
jgi:hypothetical protein